MPLTREQLIDMAVEQYFEGSNNHDAHSMVAPLSDDCVMWFNAAKYIYHGKKAIFEHLDDFAKSFKVVKFHKYVTVVDVDSQSIAVRFIVDLEDNDGEKLSMRNCNYFHANEEGKFYEVAIFNSAPIQKGFEVGSST